MFKLKKDKYSITRGGNSVILNIFCQCCGEHICFYQKDGIGELRRMYCDRIILPIELVEQVKDENFKSLKSLKCNNCNKIIAMPMIYEKEKRPALRLFVGAIKKRKLTIKEFESLTKC